MRSPVKVINARLAVADPAKYPPSAGNVYTAETRGFWRDASVTPTGQGHHGNGNGETYYLIGAALGQGMQQLLSP